MSLDDRLLEAYINSFYGYGSSSGDWWLVGMEAGGGDAGHDIQMRLKLWRAHLGRADSNNCILEFLPLPSPSVGHWIYADHSRLPQLTDRRTYTEHTTPMSVRHLRERIMEHKPKAVIFYSRAYESQWEQVAGSAFQPTELRGLDVVQGPATIFAMTLHPTYTGVTNELFQKAGRVIAGLASARAARLGT